MMNAEVKAEWLTALRSGDYKQGQHRLKSRSNRFCCLGVLCDLAAKRGLGEWTTGDKIPYFSTDEGMTMAVLPAPVVQWAGLSGPDPSIHHKMLSTYNDVSNLSFPEIANLIEVYL